MGLLKALCFVSLVYLVAAGDGVFPGPPGNNVTTTAAPTTSSEKPTTTPVPTTKPTSKSTTTSTTPKPTTTSTTTKPTTASTTTKPTTASTTTKSTTAPPTTKPTSPTTTVKPTPTPKPSPIGKWTVNYTNTDKICLVLETQLEIDVHYKEGNTTKSVTVSIPSTATSTGQCGTNIENLTLAFNTPNGTNNAIRFNFLNNTKSYDVDSVIVILNMTVPGGNDTIPWVMAHNKTAFSTPLKNSYKCVMEQSLDLLPQTNTKNYGATLRVSHLQLQAFRNTNTTKFDEALDCASSETPDAVPIAVGCALAALIIIVLIAYLIGRRRSQARGYLSM